MSPESVTVQVGATTQLSATARDAAGNVLTGRAIAWATSDSSVATVSASGLVAGVAAGSAVVSATAEGKAGSVAVTVKSTTPAPPPPETGIGVASLYDDYSPSSPHYRHIQIYAHGGFLSESLPLAEFDFAALHYDRFQSWYTDSLKGRVPTVQVFSYALALTVIQNGQGYAPGLDNAYYNDMQAWYATRSGCSLETAFVHDSTGTRRTVVHWGSNRWVIDPADACARQYQVDRLTRFMQMVGTTPADGVFIDEARPSMTEYTGSVEYAASATAQAQKDAVDYFAALKAGIGTKVFQPNVGDYADPFTITLVGAAGACHLEFMNNLTFVMDQRWGRLDLMLQTGAAINLPTAYSDTSRYYEIQGLTPGNEPSIARRGRLFELASYYMVLTTPDKVWLNVTNSRANPRQGWFRAYEADIGSPSAARSVLATGVDPAGQKYSLYQRPFTRALVLARPVVTGSATIFDDRSALSFDLPAGERWYQLRMDGSLVGPLTKVTLRNAEATILVRGSTIGL